MNKENPILSQVLRQKAIQWMDGRVILWGLNGLFNALFSQVYLQKIMERELGQEETMKILYWQGQFQSIQGISINDKKHGFAKKIPEKIKRMKLNTQQTELVGLGIFEWIKIDFEKEEFVLKSNSSFAKEYLTFIGKQKHPIDYYIRGIMAGIVEYFLEKEVLCIQTKCIGMNDRYSEYVIKTKEKWKKENNPLIEKQWVPQYPKLEDIAENKKEPYIAYEAKGTK